MVFMNVLDAQGLQQLEAHIGKPIEMSNAMTIDGIQQEAYECSCPSIPMH